MAESDENLITADTVQEQLDLPRSTVYALAERGVIPSYKIGARHVRFKRSEIEAWLATQRRAAAK
jgi:excisionase family DNA binding protein